MRQGQGERAAGLGGRSELTGHLQDDREQADRVDWRRVFQAEEAAVQRPGSRECGCVR